METIKNSVFLDRFFQDAGVNMTRVDCNCRIRGQLSDGTLDQAVGVPLGRILDRPGRFGLRRFLNRENQIYSDHPFRAGI